MVSPAHPFCSHLKPGPGQAQRRPLPNRRPCLVLHLRECVGRDGAPRIRAGAHDPIDDPGHQRAVADAVPAGDRHPDRLDGRDAVELPLPHGGAESREKLRLPHIRAGGVGQERVRLTPRVHRADEPERIPVAGRDFFGESLLKVRRGCLVH